MSLLSPQTTILQGVCSSFMIPNKGFASSARHFSLSTLYINHNLVRQSLSSWDVELQKNRLVSLQTPVKGCK